jgi:hypothetical protein
MITKRTIFFPWGQDPGYNPGDLLRDKYDTTWVVAGTLPNPDGKEYILEKDEQEVE